MKRLLNTLYITTQKTYLARKGETVLVRFEKQTLLRMPIHTLSGIVCFGRVSASPSLMHLCGESNVSISFLSENGKFYARVLGAQSGNVMLRRQQYRFADDESFTASIAQTFISAKIANARTVLVRAARENPAGEQSTILTNAANRLTHVLNDVASAKGLDETRGHEGDAARIYFSVFDHLIVAQKKDFTFINRTRRPPLDNINALLSFLYAILANDVRAALETVGLDPAVGYLHRDRPGRFGLALDLMEELRPYLADRLALSLVNRKQVKPTGFTKTETGAVSMDDATRKTVLVALQKRKQEEIEHPFLGEKIALGLVPHVQAMLLARFIRGELDAYPAFFWR